MIRLGLSSAKAKGTLNQLSDFMLLSHGRIIPDGAYRVVTKTDDSLPNESIASSLFLVLSLSLIFDRSFSLGGRCRLNLWSSCLGNSRKSWVVGCALGRRVTSTVTKQITLIGLRCPFNRAPIVAERMRMAGRESLKGWEQPKHGEWQWAGAGGRALERGALPFSLCRQPLRHGQRTASTICSSSRD